MSFILPSFLTEEPLKATGIHLGIKGAVSQDMARYVTEITPSGNPIMDINVILNRLDAVGKFLTFQNSIPPLVFGTDPRFKNALTSFHRATLIPTIQGRLVPGTLTNPQLKGYQDVSVLIVCDPANGIPTKIGQPLRGDRRAIQEASSMGIPVVAICNTNATFTDVDIAVPANNVGARAIATVFYLLARAVLIESGWQGFLGTDDLLAFETKEKLTIEDFETHIEEPEDEKEDDEE